MEASRELKSGAQTALEIVAYSAVILMVFGMAVCLGFANHERDAAQAELRNSKAFTETNAENVYWQVADNAPVTLVLPVYPSMTRLDEHGDLLLDTHELSGKPVYFRQTSCFSAAEPPYDPDASVLVCSPFPGLDTNHNEFLTITGAELQILFDHGGYAVGAVK